MKTPDTEAAVDPAEPMLRAAMKQIERAILVFDTAISAVEAGAVDTVGDAEKSCAEMRKSINNLFSERGRVDALCSQNSETHRPGTLDLDAVRDEIRRRLAGLRAARDDGGVS